ARRGSTSSTPMPAPTSSEEETTMVTTNVTTHVRRATGLAALALIAAVGIAARPEQLKFPPLSFTPPKAADYRVTLSNGIVAYLVPDRDLPLTTVHVLMRIGPDLDPAGKEGLASTMVHLLTRGGTTTRTATQIEDRVAFLGAQLESSQGQGGGGFFGGGLPIGAS